MISRQFPLSVWQWQRTETDDGSFSLPGMEDLVSFSSLWTDDDLPSDGPSELPSLQSDPAPGAGTSGADTDHPEPFATPGLLPDEASDTVLLTCSLPAAGSESHIILNVPPLLGKGSLCLNDNHLLSFNSFPGSKSEERINAGRTLDLTDLFSADHLNVLRLSFEPFRPAGICDLFSLRLFSDGQIELIHTERHKSTIHCVFRLSVFSAGQYTFRITSISDGTVLLDYPLSFPEPGCQTIEWTPAFPGWRPRHYRAHLITSARNTPCDMMTFTAGPAPRAGHAVLPIPPEDTVLYPPQLTDVLKRIGAPAVYSTVPLSQACLSALMDIGIPLCHPDSIQDQLPPAYAIHPNVRFIPPPAMLSVGIASAWQLCGLLAQPRPVPPDCPAQTLLHEIFGIDDLSAVNGLPARLAALHILHVRLHAELIRQELGYGSLCAPGEWDDSTIIRTLESVYAPCHLSLAPLQGAWFAGTTLVFSLRLFVDPASPDCPDPSGCEVRISLSEPDPASCSPLFSDTLPAEELTGKNRIFRVPLPDFATCLQLSAQLRNTDVVLDDAICPVFVGSHAILESALTFPVRHA